MIKAKEKKVIAILALAVLLMGGVSIVNFKSIASHKSILFNPTPYVDMPYHDSITALATDADAVISGRVLNVEERSIDIDYDMQSQSFYDYYVYTIEIFDSFKSSYEQGAVLEAKLMKGQGEGEYFQVGAEGLFFLQVYDDCPKDVPPELVNPYNAYIGLDFENQEVTYNAFVNEKAERSLHGEPGTYEEIMALVEAL